MVSVGLVGAEEVAMGLAAGGSGISKGTPFTMASGTVVNSFSRPEHTSRTVNSMTAASLSTLERAER